METFDRIGINKKRLKCANCGMIYDVRFHPDIGPEPALQNAKCPKCGSNAYNDATPTYQLKGGKK